MNGSSPLVIYTVQAGLPMYIAHGSYLYQVVETLRHRLELRRVVENPFTSGSDRAYDSR